MLKDFKTHFMSTALVILAIIVVTIILLNKIQSVQLQIEGLRKEINKLRNMQAPIQTQQKEQTSANTPVVEPTIPKEQEQKNEEVAPIKVPQTEIPVSEPKPIQVAVTAVPVSAPVPKSVPKPKRQINYEKLIGENLFGKIGILILVAGMGLFVKYAIDNAWINETMRTILGFLVGSSLLFTAEKLHKKYRTFSSLLAGGAFAMFYVTTAIAYHYYGLFSQTAAFIILIAVTILMSVLALIYDRRELAAIAITGGFIAPFLVSSGEGNYIILFTYILILNSGMFGLSIYKKWGELSLISFALTWLCLLLYSSSSSSTGASPINLFLFATSFFLIFLLPIVTILKDSDSWLNKILLGTVALNNFIYMGFGLYYLNQMNTGIRLNGLLTLAIALVNLGIAYWLKKQLKDYKLLLFTFLAIVVTFVSITVPLQLDGTYITIFWAAEMVLLLYLSIQSKFRLYEYFSFGLAALTLLSWRMDMPGWTEYSKAIPLFFNGYFFTNLFTGACFVAYALLLRKYKMQAGTEEKKYAPLNVIALGIACGILWYAPYHEFSTHIESSSLASIATLLFTGCYLFMLSIVLGKRFTFGCYTLGYLIGVYVNAGIFMLAFLLNAGEWLTSPCSFLAWAYWIVLLVHLFLTSKNYYMIHNFRTSQASGYTIILSITVSVFALLATWLMVNQLPLENGFNAGFSICLAITGFVQMILGMKLHFRLLRIISLITFGVILAKLILLDLWQLPTIGKIIIFIILGVVLLLLSFMYQKLKNVLFKEDQPNE